MEILEPLNTASESTNMKLDEFKLRPEKTYKRKNSSKKVKKRK
jgi:hypothetical protein